MNYNEMKSEELVEMARTVEGAERYEDMCTVMKMVVQKSSSEGLSTEERNLLSVAYKNVVGARRASLRAVTSDASGPVALMEEYKKQLQDELEGFCSDILDQLSNNLIVEEDQDEGQVFYLKMAADYYRYLAECIPDETSHADNAAKYYERAFDIAKGLMASTHPIRLGLALNYSVCLYEIVKKPDLACELAKKAFDEAIAQLDQLAESDYKDSTLIMQLLRDNLTLWTSKDADDDEN